jgi:hypothetical protein
MPPMTMTGQFPFTFDVEGPVQAEMFVVWLNGDRLELSGPCGAAPWYVELSGGEHPLSVVERIVRDALGPARLVHSTSWRRDREAVILSFVVVVEAAQVRDFASVPIGRSHLARSDATSAPVDISYAQVLEHGLRHLAWLVRDDPVVARELASDAWRSILADYVPEPFRALGA